jgi:hypothetical protein
MIRTTGRLLLLTLILALATSVAAQEDFEDRRNTLYDMPPRWLVDMPTAGTLHRGYYNIGLRIYPEGGGLGYTDIGLSGRFMLGISYGAEHVVSNQEPNWNPRIGFSLRFRVIDEMEYFPAISIGYTDQGLGPWIPETERYAFKSRGFYAVASRSFYFYKWTSGWHVGINYSLEDDVDHDDDVDFFLGADATFNYNLGLLIEYDPALNDDKSAFESSGKGRGYLNASIKWLFTESLELEVVAKDLLVNRRESDTFTREVRMTYISSF